MTGNNDQARQRGRGSADAAAVLEVAAGRAAGLGFAGRFGGAGSEQTWASRRAAVTWVAEHAAGAR